LRIKKSYRGGWDAIFIDKSSGLNLAKGKICRYKIHFYETIMGSVFLLFTPTSSGNMPEKVQLLSTQVFIPEMS
jgi:hypothetical protein